MEIVQIPIRRPMRKRRTRNPEESRKAIVAAAAKQFNTVGYLETDSNRIARAAGYAPGTFYTHFADKRAVFLEVYYDWVRAESSMIRSVLALDLSPKSKRHRLVTEIIEHHRQWKTFRASLRALCATDEQARLARLREREKQVNIMEEWTRRDGTRKPNRAEIWYAMLSFEAVCDSIADGDLKAMKIRDSDILAPLEAMLQLLTK